MPVTPTQDDAEQNYDTLVPFRRWQAYLALASNLILLCSRHHHRVHQERITIDLLPNGHATFTTFDGNRTYSEPRGAPPHHHQYN